MLDILIFWAALSAYALFLVRFAWQGLLWFRASGQTGQHPAAAGRPPVGVYLSTVLDVLFFRRLFACSKLLWLCSWTFHVSFFFVVLRHMRYFFPSLSDCLIFIQPVGLFAGYLLPLSVMFLIVLRVVRGKDRYASAYNYVLSGMLFLISTTGIMMRMYFSPDLIGVKQFSLGIFGLNPYALPDSGMFLLHLVLCLLLLPFLPVHFFAVPFVTFEANRRQEELKVIIHDA